MIKKGKIITEDDEVVFEHEDDLSFSDTHEKFVALYVLDDFVGNTKVYLDSEMESREYIVINHTICYLDTLKEKKVKGKNWWEIF